MTLDTTYSSSGKVLPFGYNIQVGVPSGSSLTITNQIKLLSGEIIQDDGTLTIESGVRLYVYNTEQYSRSFNFAGWTAGTDAAVSGSGSIVNDGVYAESAFSGRYSAYEYVQGSISRTTVRFAAIA